MEDDLEFMENFVSNNNEEEEEEGGGGGESSMMKKTPSSSSLLLPPKKSATQLVTDATQMDPAAVSKVLTCLRTLALRASSSSSSSSSASSTSTSVVSQKELDDALRAYKKLGELPPLPSQKVGAN